MVEVANTHEYILLLVCRPLNQVPSLSLALRSDYVKEYDWK